MPDSAAERRLAENEVYFREQNKRLQASIDVVNKMAAEDGDRPLQVDRNTQFYFQCECSDEKCRARLKLTLGEYESSHKEPDTFIIKSGHDVASIESIIQNNELYTLVRKNNLPPATAKYLNPTHLDHS